MIRVTVTDLDTGESESKDIDNDYLLIAAGTAELTSRQVSPTTGTHQLTVKGVQS